MDSRNQQPLWLRILVNGMVVILAIGMVYIVSRNGLIQREKRLSDLEQEICTILEERYELLTGFSSQLTESVDEDLSLIGRDLQSALPGQQGLELCSLRSEQQRYLEIDRLMQMGVIALTRSQVMEITVSLVAAIEALQENEQRLSEPTASYNTQVISYRNARSSVVNLMANATAELKSFEEFHIETALHSPY
jgi:hypothetical protein